MKSYPRFDAGLRNAFGQRQEVPPRVDVLFVAFAFHQHDGPQTRQTIANRQELLELVVVLDNGHARLAVLGDVVALVGRQGGVDTGRKASRGHATEGGEEPLRPVEPEDGDTLAGLEAERHERPAYLEYRGLVLTPGRRMPAAIPLCAQGRSLTVHRGALGEDVEDRLTRGAH
jgi:hypothetical protein